MEEVEIRTNESVSYAGKEFPETDSGLSSPVNTMDGGDNIKPQAMTVAEVLGEERPDIPKTIQMWASEDTMTTHGSSSLIERVMEAESRASSPTDAGGESEEESDGEPTVWVADPTNAIEMVEAVEELEKEQEQENLASAPTTDGKKKIPATIAMWDDEKGASPARPSADERFARLKEARLRGVHMQNAPNTLPVDASSMVLAAVDTVSALRAGSIASLPAGADLTSPSRFAGGGTSGGLRFEAYGKPNGDKEVAETPVQLTAEYQYQTAPTRMLGNLGPSEKTPLFNAEDKSITEGVTTCENVAENCTVM